MFNLEWIKIKKGFTLIEIIVTMTILFITLSIVSPLLNYNLKSLYTTESKNDLQRDAYSCMENFTKRAMEASSIEEISNNPDNLPSSSLMSEKTVESIKYIKFITGEGTNYIFKLDTNAKTLTETTTNTVVANDVKDIQLQPLPVDSNDPTGRTSVESFETCGGVKIQIEFSKRLADSYIVTSEVKFRNWSGN